ncbi:E3 ubiquitin-protein ligase TRIM39-like [Solea senegalensis]|nr:E3 ubiquitin-protein ligase TRIM39-like [Solea senegalensis]
MASHLLKEQFKCCICLDIYTDPVSIPCAHNFCLVCIEGYWDIKGKSECPLCKNTFRKRPSLNINLDFANMIEVLKRATQEDGDAEVQPGSSSLLPSQRSFDADNAACDVCQGDKLPAVKSCLVCQASYCETHVEPHCTVPALQWHRLLDPASFTSSHVCRKHDEPLTLFCKTDQRPVCAKCTDGTHRRHQVVPLEKESKRIKSHMKATKMNIQQLIQTRKRKMEEIRNSVDQSKKNTDREIESNAHVYTTLIKAIHEHYSGLVEELEEKHAEAERQAKELLDELEQEIQELQMRGDELRQLKLIKNPLHLLQGFPSLSILPPTQDWSDVAIHADNSLWTVRRAINKLSDVCQAFVNQLSAEEAEKMNQYAVDVTLDPETASGWLMLSPDGKKVSVSSQKRKTSFPENPQRFDTCVCVLGKQSFTSGRRYWVVQVKDKTDWDIGIARKSINRKGSISVCPDGGFWAICRRQGGSLTACAGRSIPLHLQKAPEKVGVFLDYEERSVSFYDAEAKTHIYTYSGCDFAEPLYAYFNPCVQNSGKNAAPLVICAPPTRHELTIESSV